MPGPGRNERCPCGSGRKVKRCCGQRRGPSPEALAQAALALLAQDAVELALPELLAEDRLALVDRLVDLPERHDELLVPVPAVESAEVLRLRRGIEAHDGDATDAALTATTALLGGLVVRERLVGALLGLRDAGRVSAPLAAVGACDLEEVDSVLLRASVLQSVAVTMGVVPRASGLLVGAGASGPASRSGLWVPGS